MLNYNVNIILQDKKSHLYAKQYEIISTLMDSCHKQIHFYSDQGRMRQLLLSEMLQFVCMYGNKVICICVISFGDIVRLYQLTNCILLFSILIKCV